MKRTNRILPVYAADISGVCSALYELGGMTVMHDASGCNSTYTTHDEPRWYSMDSMVYISALSELEAVMGDDEKLIRDIVDAAGNLHPNFICLGGTPIPMIMGTDFKGIAKLIERQTGIPTFGIPANGMHSYIQGAGEALKRIAERFCGEQGEAGKNVREGNLSVNILGVTPLDFSLTGNAANIRTFLENSGFEVISCWAMESSLEDLKRAGNAAVNLVVSAAGIPAAKTLKKRFGTPFVIGTPLSRRTEEELTALLKEAAEDGKDRVLFKNDGTVGDGCRPAGLTGLPDSLKGRRTVIIGEQVISGSLRRSLRQELEADSVCVICPTEGTTDLAEEGDMLEWDEDNIIRLLSQSEAVIADPLYKLVCPHREGQIFVDFPHEACSGRMYHDVMKPFVPGLK